MEENISEQNKRLEELQADFSKLQEEFGKLLLMINKNQSVSGDYVPGKDIPITGPRTIAWSTKRAELERKYSSENRPVKEISSPADIFKDE